MSQGNVLFFWVLIRFGSHCPSRRSRNCRINELVWGEKKEKWNRQTERRRRKRSRDIKSLFVPLPTFLALYGDHRLATSSLQELCESLWAQQMAKVEIPWGWAQLRGIWTWLGWPWVMSPGNCVAAISVFRLEKRFQNTQNSVGLEGLKSWTKASQLKVQAAWKLSTLSSSQARQSSPPMTQAIIHHTSCHPRKLSRRHITFVR